MSATTRTYQASYTVEDHDRMDPAIVTEAEQRGASVDDVVTERINQVMTEAGQAYIDAHPDQFRVQSLS